MTPESLASALPIVLQRLRDALNPRLIYLYGSAVTGHVGPSSDIDVLVIVDDSPLSFFDRAALAYRSLANVGVPVDVQVYTNDEFARRAALPVSFEKSVQTKGRVVYAA